jgi:hypothetical protein
MKIALNTNFINVNLPPIDSNQPFYPSNCFSILLIKNLQSVRLNFFQCRGTPKYFIGNILILQPNSYAILLLSCSDILRGLVHF